MQEIERYEMENAPFDRSIFHLEAEDKNLIRPQRLPR